MPRIYEYGYTPTAEDVMSSYINGRMAMAKGHEEYQNFIQNMQDEPGDYGWRRMVRGMLEEAKQKQDTAFAQRKETASAAVKSLFGDNPVSSGASFTERVAALPSGQQGNVEDRTGDAPMSLPEYALRKAFPVEGFPYFLGMTLGRSQPATGIAKQAGLGDIQARPRMSFGGVRKTHY